MSSVFDTKPCTDRDESAAKASQPEERWETLFYNSYGNYNHYRFQDFRSGCEHRDDDGRCAHPENELGPGPDAECLCHFCPLVEEAYQREDPTAPDYDPTDWSEGEQPIFVNAEPSGGAEQGADHG